MWLLMATRRSVRVSGVPFIRLCDELLRRQVAYNFVLVIEHGDHRHANGVAMLTVRMATLGRKGVEEATESRCKLGVGAPFACSIGMRGAVRMAIILRVVAFVDIVGVGNGFEMRDGISCE